MTQALAALREWAHNLLAPLGVLLVAPGVAGDVATFFNAHINGLGNLNTASFVGFIFASTSKFIDSANNAVTSTKPVVISATVTPSAGPAPIPDPAPSPPSAPAPIPVPPAPAPVAPVPPVAPEPLG